MHLCVHVWGMHLGYTHMFAYPDVCTPLSTPGLCACFPSGVAGCCAYAPTANRVCTRCYSVSEPKLKAPPKLNSGSCMRSLPLPCLLCTCERQRPSELPLLFVDRIRPLLLPLLPLFVVESALVSHCCEQLHLLMITDVYTRRRARTRTHTHTHA